MDSYELAERMRNAEKVMCTCDGRGKPIVIHFHEIEKIEKTVTIGDDKALSPGVHRVVERRRFVSREPVSWSSAADFYRISHAIYLDAFVRAANRFAVARSFTDTDVRAELGLAGMALGLCAGLLTRLPDAIPDGLSASDQRIVSDVIRKFRDVHNKSIDMTHGLFDNWRVRLPALPADDEEEAMA
jgi:hypothetical protein